MFLTQLTIDRLNRSTCKILGNVYLMHQKILSPFKGMKDIRAMYRVETEDETTVQILLQSPIRPVWSEGFPGLIEVKSIPLQLENLTPGFYHFRLRANPSINREGKRFAIIRQEPLEAWLKSKESSLGVLFHSIQVVDEGYLFCEKEEKKENQSGNQIVTHKIKIKMAKYSGILEVKDVALTRSAIIRGVGPAKSFGCGLLSLRKF